MSLDGSNDGMIQSDKTLLDILDELRARDGAGVTELSEAVDISKSTIHKHLKTLEANDYVENRDGTYHLGLRFLRFAGLARNRNPLCFAAKDWVEHLATETTELTTFAIENGGKGMWTYMANDHYQMRREYFIGSTFKLHQVASGKAILSTFPDERVEHLIEQHGMDSKTDSTITDPGPLFQELEQIRDEGVAVSAGEYEQGVLAIAAPVEDEASGTVGSLGFAGPSSDMTREKLVDDYKELLLDAANKLALQIHYI